MDHTELVAAVKADLEARGVNLQGPCGAFEITGRVAWILRAEGWGLIAKNPGQNGCSIHGGRFAVDALAKEDGSSWVDLLVNAENENRPAWQEKPGSGQPDPSWTPPFQMDSGPVTPPQPPQPPTPPSTDLKQVIALLIEAHRKLDDLIARPPPPIQGAPPAPDYVGTVFGVKVVLRPVK